jgi:hypothetical protein
MTLIPIGVLVFLSASALAQAPNNAPPPTVQRICGKLEYTHDVPVKGDPKSVVAKEKDVRHADVDLYPATENGQCCEGLAAASTTRTGHWGSFELKSKHLPGGLYWLHVEWNDRKYQMLIQYEYKKYPDQLCSQAVWEVNDAGELRKVLFITVD